ncbi:MAG: MBL fold metallo-hydrolase [Anaerolineales bacterium]|jgi:L-ascorbate metabolism protein UlaG (beta-lactamase superfamily)
MEITWYGLSCFRLTERGMISIVTDPYGAELGLPALKLKADVVTVSHEAPGHADLTAVKGVRRVVNSPGEYEIGGVFITGVRMQNKKDKKSSANGNTLYVFNYEGLAVAHLGDLSDVPTQAQIEDLGAVDVALVPVGGGNALSPSQAAEVISLIEPSIVIPMHFKTGKETLKLGTAEGFLKEMGIADQEAQPSLKVVKGSLSEETQVVVLKPAA